MGNLFITTGAADSDAWFQRGLALAGALKRATPGLVRAQGEAARLALFPRRNGSGGRFARDERSGDWLAACGSWFHADGLAVGDELRLLARIAERGLDPVARELEGAFVLVQFDAATGELRVVTDLTGSRHAFLRELGGTLALSTSSLLLAGLTDAPPDPLGLREFLQTGVIYEERTLFRDVRKLPPASIFRFAANGLREERRYWRAADLDPEAFEGEAAVERLTESLASVARRIQRVYPSPVCDLTGGFDSRAVTAAFLRAGVPFETTVSGPPRSADVLVSTRLASLTGRPHWHIEPDSPPSLADVRAALAWTDGECDLVAYARIAAIHGRLSAGFDASVNGSYGELARGYWWELLWPRAGARRPIDSYALAARRYAVELASAALAPDFDPRAHLAGVIERAVAECAAGPNTMQMDQVYLALRMQRWQGRIASSTDQLWPCLSPFQFRSALETALGTRPGDRVRNRMMRALLARLHPALASAPLESGAPALPLSLRTWPRFLPALRDPAAKVWRKAMGTGRAPDAGASPRLRLWREEETQAMLDPVAMRLADWIEPARLRGFLQASREAAFGFDAQWNRVLSVECALQWLRAHRSE